MRARAGGITLVETLIAISLFVLVVSLAAPAIVGASAERRFRLAMEQVAGALADARNDAVLSGEPIEVVAEADEEGRWRIAARPLSASPAADPGDAPSSDPAGRRVRLTLEPGLRFVGAEELRGLDRSTAPPEQETLIDDPNASPEASILAIFLPDGGAGAGVDMVLADGEGRRAALMIGAWTGSAVLLRDDAAAPTDFGAQTGRVGP